MSIAATKELQALFGQFEHAYFERPDDVDVVLHRVMAVATCLDRLRSEGYIGAYLGGMDNIDRIYREAPERTLMEDPRDPVIMQAIADHFPIHTMTGLHFFMGSGDEVMQSAIRSYAAHMQVRSAYTLKNDSPSVVRNLMVNGLVKSADDFLSLMEEISKHDPQIMPKGDFATTLCGAFEGVLGLRGPVEVSQRLRGFVDTYLTQKKEQFQVSYPYIEAAMGLAKAGYQDLSIDIAREVFPRARKLDENLIVQMESLGMQVEPILDKVAQKTTLGWAEAYFAYRLQTSRENLDVHALDLTDTSIKGAAKRMIMKICVQDHYNLPYAKQLLGEYGRLYPNEGREFSENPKLKPLAITVDRYREAAMGADLGL